MVKRFTKSFFVALFICMGLCHAVAQYTDNIKIPYPDSLKHVGIKFDAASPLSNHLLAGFEIPLQKDCFLEFNVGITGIFSGLNTYDEFEYDLNVHKGFIFRSGVKLPIRYTTALSLIYLMPEFSFTGFTVDDYDFNNSIPKTVRVRSQAALLNFGYRHINPNSGFFYDVNLGYGLGFTNDAEFGLMSYGFLIAGNSTAPNTRVNALASSFRISFGWVLGKKHEVKS